MPLDDLKQSFGFQGGTNPANAFDGKNLARGRSQQTVLYRSCDETIVIRYCLNIRPQQFTHHLYHSKDNLPLVTRLRLAQEKMVLEYPELDPVRDEGYFYLFCHSFEEHTPRTCLLDTVGGSSPHSPTHVPSSRTSTSQSCPCCLSSKTTELRTILVWTTNYIKKRVNQPLCFEALLHKRLFSFEPVSDGNSPKRSDGSARYAGLALHT